MQCPRCQHENPSGVKFCGECGARLDLACPARGYEARAVRLLGEISARKDPPDVVETEDHYRHALTLAEQLGMRPLIAHRDLGLRRLYRRTGKQYQAREYLATATDMMRELEMGLWLEKVEADLKELD